jgi:hypothetical protein
MLDRTLQRGHFGKPGVLLQVKANAPGPYGEHDGKACLVFKGTLDYALFGAPASPVQCPFSLF